MTSVRIQVAQNNCKGISESALTIFQNLFHQPVNRRMMEMRMKIPLNGRLPMLCIVFCGGKCGSSTLHSAFSSMNIPSVRIHNVDHFVDEYAPFLRGNPIRDQLHLDVLLKFFLTAYEKIIVIDAYRDPVERRISSFFQNFRVNLGRGGITETRWAQVDKEQRMIIFQNCIMPLLENRNGIDTMCPAFFAGEFDFRKGFQKMIHPDFPSVVLLKLRFHDIRRWQTILRSALPEYSIPEMTHENDSLQKPYAEEYKQWRNEFCFKKNDFLWKLILDPIFCKYHTPDELIRYFTTWTAAPHTTRVAVSTEPPVDKKQAEAMSNFMQLYEHYVKNR